ncbi:protease II [Arthrobacter sp. UYCu723]
MDNAGDERFTLRIKNLRSAELLPDVIENVFYGISFSPDGTRTFYTVVDDSWRPYQVKSHVLGTPVSEDEVIYQEDDVAMWLGFELSADRRHLVLSIVISRDEHTLYEAEPFLFRQPLWRTPPAGPGRRLRRGAGWRRRRAPAGPG